MNITISVAYYIHVITYNQRIKLNTKLVNYIIFMIDIDILYSPSINVKRFYSDIGHVRTDYIYLVNNINNIINIDLLLT